MRENICFYFMQTHVLFILSLVLLWFNTTAATSLGHKLVVAAGGATNTCIDNERQALLGFKARLQDPYDDQLSTWRPEEEEDCCKWGGVTCDNETGHVTMLDLCDYTSGVGGEISPSLLNLTYLNHLDLSYCSFHGTIPPFIGSMTRLTYLNLSDNEFTGTITMSIGSLTGLTYLDLSWNQFTGTIPMFIGNMTQLIYLGLSSNEFVGTIPMSFGSLTSLTFLDLGGNQLHIHSFTDLTLLFFVNIMSGTISDTMSDLVFPMSIGNNFSGSIPESIGNMTKLIYLDLSYNHFVGTIPEFIGNMTQLIYLDLSYNQFVGTIPMSIRYLTNLTNLYLDDNNLSGTIPEFIGSMTKLIDLSLSGNDFSGSIPRSIGSLTNLTYLDLTWNNFSGIIPRSIGSLTKLESLNLDDNSFHGTIPQEFGNLTNLLTLSLGSLLGSCTVENLDWLSSLSRLELLNMDGTSLAKANNWVNVIIGLQNLKTLRLSTCDLSKVMHPYSSVFNSSPSIYSLHLYDNNLNSSAYRWLCPLVGNMLTDFSVSGNSFGGKLSDFLNKLSRCTSPNMLNILDASNNQLTGPLSDQIQNFSSLYMLNLSSNLLSGVISENIGKSNLLYVDLSWNSLEGDFFNDDMSNLSTSVAYIDFSSNKLGPRFPKSMQKMKKLTHLDLSNNRISDTIPTEYWNQWRPSQLTHLDLSFNNISGILPESLSSPGLEKVDLSSNSFYGPIPTFPARINYLDLSRNKFQGRISLLCQIYENFEFLDLSRNSLTGQFPDCLTNLTYLKVLNLGHNLLSGHITPYVGRLGQLETLCLYNNSFSGELPMSLKNCTKLSLLDLGANKLFGNIPAWIGKNLSRLYALSLKSNNFSGVIPSQICQLVSLQILDLSFNNLHGTIPSCVHNLTSMVQKGLFTEHNLHNYSSNVTLGNISIPYGNSYIDHLLIQWQGKVNEFGRNLRLVKTIDLSTNSLTGQIPYEITNLQGLVVLNLSHNALLGEIPKDIGQMQELQTLDLSKNSFSGGLPSSMSKMNFLNYLDVSHNNLSGRIPSGTQLQTFEPSRYIGNAGLCGPPLTKDCPGDTELEVTPVVGESKNDGEDVDELKRWFYIGGASGFVTAFWIVVGALLLNRRARHAFFQCQDSLKDWVYVKVMVFMAKWRRVARV